MNNTDIIFGAYRKFCKLAASDPAVFDTFKRHPDYVPILEHVSFVHGAAYLDTIKEKNPHLLKLIEKFKENDKVGHPNTCFYRETGDISPTTLRYIKTASDLIDIFDSWENESIFELGAGYGGQCKVLSDIFQPKKYTMADLPEVVLLIEQFVKRLNIGNVHLCTEETIPSEEYDLFISNYAFTEIDRKLQQMYIDKVISKSTHGYITCNFVSRDVFGINSYTREELLSHIPHQYTIVDEIPCTDEHKKNFLLLW